MEPRDITRIRFASDPQHSPDGSRIAFVVTTLSEERDEYLSNVWIVDAAGGEPRRFTTGPKRDTSPRWSPDGQHLAFVSERESKKRPQLYVVAADGGEARRITELEHGVTEPTWAPDGRRLAFLSKVGGQAEPKDEDRDKSRPARVIDRLKYRFNGEGFIYDRKAHIFVVGMHGEDPRQITDGDFADADPAWSPDGASIAFVSARHAERDEDNASDLWLVSPEGGEPRKLTRTQGPVRRPSWSPDSREIAYLGTPYARGGVGRHTRLYVVGVDGGEPRCLSAAYDRNFASFQGANAPLWVDAGSALLVAPEEEGDVPLLRLPLGGGEPQRVVEGTRQVTGYSTAPDGRIAFVATSPTDPADVYVVDGGEERRLTDLNRQWRAEVGLSQPERFRFERDGFRVDGWAVKPHGFEPGRRYPVLLNVHGGPATQYGHNFFDEFQVYAGAGYAVVYVNPRGSQGYSEAFARAVVGDWGGGDYADVMAGLDEALRRFDFLDPDRLGVMGGSYGGYITTWTVGHTDRFKAACSERALNTFGSFFGTSDIGHYFAEDYLGVAPWEKPEVLARHSPLSFARDIKTPLLIMHAEEDWRCPIEQAEQLFVVLKKLGRETLFIRFPGENHEMSRSGKPRHRIERFEHILSWFGRFLKP